jgi:hypothetical protein
VGDQERVYRATSLVLGGVALLFVCLLFVGPAVASAATIDFEDRPNGDTVNTDYSSQGVTFNGPAAVDYGTGFMHSGTKGIQGCTVDPEGCSFASPPPVLRADFTTGQTAVGVWVGSRSSSSMSVRLTAFDGGGAEVGHQDVTMPANSPVNNHLTVTSGSANIRALEVARTDPSGIFDMVVDDVEFSAAGPPPPCGATAPPTVTLTSPANNTYLQNNTVLLKGSTNGHGAPITDATVVSEGDTTRTAIGFPTPINAGGGSFAVNMGGLLQPGNQKVFVTATNCAGTGVSTNPIVVYNPLPAGTGFQQLAPIEVTQSVQSPFNPVPLIAGGANGTKRTIARVELGATGTNTPITGVTGQLTATRPDGSRPDGPLAVDSLNTATVPVGTNLDDARASLGSSLEFELPSQWLTEGRLHLQLDHLAIEGEQTPLACVNCDNWGGIPATVSFHRVPPLRIWLVGVPWTPGDGHNGPINPRQKDFDMLTSWLKRAYPASDVQVTQSALPVTFDQPGYEDDPDTPANEHRDGFLCDDVNSRLSDFVSTIPAQPAGTRYYGLVADADLNGDGFFMRGCSNIGGRFGSGPAGSGTFGWDNDGSYADWYGGHEIGHMFDRLHPNGGCEDSDDDDNFPYLGGQIGNTNFDNQGIDPGDSTFGIGLSLMDWKSWHDVMTYCKNQWLSSYTYNGILKNLCNGDASNCPDRKQLTKNAPKKGGPRLAVNATFDYKTHRHVDLQPMTVLKGLTLTDRPGRSPLALLLRNRAGKTIARYPLEAHVVSDQPRGSHLASINDVVPFLTKTKRILLVDNGAIIAQRNVSAHAPKVKLKGPKGKSISGPVKLRWKAHDRDGGKLISTLQYAADGKHFETIAADLKKRKYKVDTSQLAGGEKARFRVVVTDGVLTGIDKSKRVSVPARAPQLSIATPVDGATFAQGQSVQLVASVQDDQDPHLFDAVAWSSDQQGALGTGGMLTTVLQPGTHKLTATVTNSLGISSTASVNVTVEANAPTVNAQLIP